jgi:hypothetical protein
LHIASDVSFHLTALQPLLPTSHSIPLLNCQAATEP